MDNTPPPSGRDLALLRYREACRALHVDNDPAAALALCTETAALALELGATDIELAALSLEGVALIMLGDVGAGVHCLDEVDAAVQSGELSQPWALAEANRNIAAGRRRLR